MKKQEKLEPIKSPSVFGYLWYIIKGVFKGEFFWFQFTVLVLGSFFGFYYGYFSEQYTIVQFLGVYFLGFFTCHGLWAVFIIAFSEGNVGEGDFLSISYTIIWTFNFLICYFFESIYNTFSDYSTHVERHNKKVLDKCEKILQDAERIAK